MNDQFRTAEKALKDAGYETVVAQPREVPVTINQKDGKAALFKTETVIDLCIEPANVLGKDKNFAALPILKSEGVAYEDVRVFNDRLIVRNASHTKPAAKGKKPTA